MRCVIVPAKDESARLGEVLRGLSVLEDTEVFVVDDGSTDATGEISRQAGVGFLANNGVPGRDAAVQFALKFVLGGPKSYDWYIVFDGDGQHDVSFIRALPGRYNSNSLYKGSRFLPASPRRGVPIDRAALARLLQYLFSDLTHCNVTDANCGLLALQRSQLEWAFSECSFKRHFSIEIVLRWLMQGDGIKNVVELPIPATFSVASDNDYKKYIVESAEQRFFARASTILECICGVIQNPEVFNTARVWDALERVKKRDASLLMALVRESVYDF
jgi:glycosyltransferase involved in cell wall biosynthesis